MIITYCVASVVVFLFGAAACLVAYIRHKRVGPDTTEFFLTARKSVGTFRIAWSFYAAAMGSWTLFSPAQYSWNAGEDPAPYKPAACDGEQLNCSSACMHALHASLGRASPGINACMHASRSASSRG